MKYHAFFVILKKGQNLKLLSAAIIGGALRVKIANGLQHSYMHGKNLYSSVMMMSDVLSTQDMGGVCFNIEKTTS